MSPEERKAREEAAEYRRLANIRFGSLIPPSRHAFLMNRAAECDLQADLIAIEGLDPDPFALRPGDAALLRGETLPGATADEPAGRLWADLYQRMADGPDLPGGPLATTEAL